MLLVLACTAPGAAAEDEDQWLFHLPDRAGSFEPAAVFLSWDYSAVIFRATCDHATQELVLRFFGDTVTPPTASTPPLSISSAKHEVTLATRLDGMDMVGRLKVGPDLNQILDDPSHLAIDAPNEMDEPFYVGHAEALRRLAALCQ